MFLMTRKKNHFYLVIMDDTKRLDMNRFKELVGEKQIKMASAECLLAKMQLPPGVVSPFGLLNNEDKDIQVYVDKAIVHEARMSFHPNTNDKTIFIQTDDLFRFLAAIGYAVNIVDL
ncbi:YbaK/prolyl-tRNA synthetases associated domain protein [Streptococcus equi subsp. zooepidemicus Sz5]|nr:YbaK/prolyl-tRNA synthetases associated domain protein [Streptococcus equi subsp. zooepidemicus Sz5]